MVTVADSGRGGRVRNSVGVNARHLLAREPAIEIVEQILNEHETLFVHSPQKCAVGTVRREPRPQARSGESRFSGADALPTVNEHRMGQFHEMQAGGKQHVEAIMRVLAADDLVAEQGAHESRNVDACREEILSGDVGFVAPGTVILSQKTN